MRRAYRLSLVLLLACVGPAAAQTPPAMAEPTDPYIPFRIDVITGALMPLESIWTKPDRSGNSYYCYIPGAASPVAFTFGESLKFVMRVGGLKDPPKLENWRQCTSSSGSSLKRVESSDRITASEPQRRAIAPAVIYVYSPKAFSGMGAKSKVLCDGQHVADLANGRFIMLKASPGSHNFEVQAENKSRKAAVSFAAGSEHYIRVAFRGFPVHTDFRIMNPAEGAAEMRQKEVRPNEQQHTFSAECSSVSAAPAR